MCGTDRRAGSTPWRSIAVSVAGAIALVLTACRGEPPATPAESGGKLRAKRALRGPETRRIVERDAPSKFSFPLDPAPEGSRLLLTFAGSSPESEGILVRVRGGDLNWSETVPKTQSLKPWVEVMLGGDTPLPREIEVEILAPPDGTELAGGLLWGVPRVIEPADPSRPNLVLFSIDTLRADVLGAYGCPHPTSPHFDRLSRRGALLSRAYSSSNWTLPAFATMFSGVHPSRHGVYEDSRGLSPRVTTLPRILANRGYATGGFHHGGYLGHERGFDRGFDVYRQTRGVRSLGISLAWLRRFKEHPSFLFFHTYDIHAPYRPIAEPWSQFHPGSSDPDLDDRLTSSKPADLGETLSPPEVERLWELYWSQVPWVDHGLGRLEAALRDTELQRRTVLVVTSDHGEEFGELETFEHRTANLHPALTQIPLVIAGPGTGEGVVNPSVVGLADLMPTLLDLLRVNLPSDGLAKLDGASFRGLLKSPAVDPERMAVSQRPRIRGFAVRGARASVRGGIEGFQVYDTVSDPGEYDPVPWEQRRKPNLVKRYEASVPSVPLAPAEELGQREISEERRQELEALGYLE